jgi:hypothetical protein
MVYERTGTDTAEDAISVPVNGCPKIEGAKSVFGFPCTQGKARNALFFYHGGQI